MARGRGVQKGQGGGGGGGKGVLRLVRLPAPTLNAKGCFCTINTPAPNCKWLCSAHNLVRCQQTKPWAPHGGGAMLVCWATAFALVRTEGGSERPTAHAQPTNPQPPQRNSKEKLDGSLY